jgi:predicted DNA-binding protein with PD1-like motif
MNQNALVAEGRTSELIAVRLRPGVDVTEGLLEVCREKEITAGSIEVLIGGADAVKLIVPVADKSSPSGVGPKQIEVPHPVAFTGGQGMVCTREDGQLEIHLHVSVVDEERLYGGDLVKGSATVTTTADAIICKIDGVTFLREFDPQANAVVFHPTPKKS